MKRTLLRLIYLVVLGTAIMSCQKEVNLIELEINQNWLFRDVNDTLWCKAEVPGYVHTDLMKNKLIPDPFYRMNEHELQWIDKTDWEYKTIFSVDENILEKDAVIINFKGLDTHADVYLNNELILKANNMFISWDVNCKKILKINNNELKIIFHSPVKVGLEKMKELEYDLPFSSNDQSELGGLGNKKVSVFSRKAGYHFGWDWGPRLVSSGIWQEVVIKAFDILKITDLNIIQNKISDDEAILSANIEIESLEEGEFTLNGFIDSEKQFKKNVQINKGTNIISASFDIKNPKLWWTSGLGDQKLYDIEVQITKNSEILSIERKNIGLRTLEVVQQDDSVGKSFYFRLNYQPVFMKGANYIPQDIFLNRIQDADYERIIKAAVDANFNMLRVWGGGIYEKEIFYDLCDKYGILVWQDFMFACAMYPGNEEFLENVRNEAIQNIKRLRNHACLALWCGDNEILLAWNNWGWKEETIEKYGTKTADTIWDAYNKVFHELLPSVVNDLDPQRLYWSSSPSAGFGELEDGKSGDRHYWDVWWGKKPFANYEKEIPRFMSEYGFQSFPEFSSVKKYTTEEDWDINSEVMNSHQRSSIGNITIREYLLRDYKSPKNFEMFLYVGQLLQARGVGIGMEAHRRNMPYCMGSLYWQINDCWPVASWSSIDYYGKWKALHYQAKQSFKKIKLSPYKNNDNINIYIISDDLEDKKAILQLTISNFNGDILYEHKREILLKGNTSKIYFSENQNVITQGFEINNIFLKSELFDSEKNCLDTDLYYFVAPKDLNLPNPNLKYEITEIDQREFEIKLISDVLAKNVYLNCETEGFFSDNYFDLPPNESIKIMFTADKELNQQNFIDELKIITLVDSYENLQSL